MKFAKLHALGNDFLIIDVAGEESQRQSLSPLAKRICDRHCGIGADGLLCFHATARDLEADVSALIFNADGTKAEMSGNGVRCLAAYLVHNGESTSGLIRIRTVSGIKTITLREKQGSKYTFECSMGAPVTSSKLIPAAIGETLDPILDYPLEIESKTIPVTLTSMGNPHCSTFWQHLDGVPVHSIGPALEQHIVFPRRTNVEFIQVLDSHRLRVRFWERGVGPTLASGTGACAAAVAAILHGRAESPVAVETELGSLRVAWEKGGAVSLTGEAEYICDGEYLDSYI